MDGLPLKLDTKLGRVVTVSGAHVIVLLEPGSGESAGGNNPQLQIGALVTMQTPASTLFGLVAGLNVPMPTQQPTDAELRLVELELIGETTHGETKKRRFQRGVSLFPMLGDAVFTATLEDLALVYASAAPSAVRIGTVHQDESLPAYVVADDLLGKHFAVLGTTGSGKSCAVALILRALLADHSNGHVVLLDMHNEYSRAFGDSALVLEPGKLELPYWLFTFEELEEVVLGGAPDRQVQAAILSEFVRMAKGASASNPDKGDPVKLDTPIPYRMGDVTRLIDEAAGKLDKAPDVSPYVRLKARLAALQTDSRFSFMFPGVTVRDNMTEILSTLFRIPVNGKPITIIDLSSVPSEVLNVVVSVVCRMTFDFALWSEQAVPILLVCEEAHRYCPHEAKTAFEPTKRALSRIAKEGRKYGVSLCLVSQRPSELSASILSQCNTIFALRLGHQSDQEFVRGALPEAAVALLDFLPSLRNAEAIAIGEGVPVPVRLCFDELPDEFRPRSGTASFSAAWSADVKNTAFLKSVVERWRRQRRVGRE